MATFTATDPTQAHQRIWGTLKPYGNLTYPLFDTADGAGGQRSVTTITSTNPPVSHRKGGMLVFQTSDHTMYRLDNDLTTWSKQSSGASGVYNGLYDYIKHPVNADGVHCEEYKWDNGRVEYYLRFPALVTYSGSGEFFYRRYPKYYFPTPFANDRYTTVQVTNVDNNGSLAFAEFEELTEDYIVLVMMGYTNTTKAYGHAFVNGMWK